MYESLNKVGNKLILSYMLNYLIRKNAENINY